MASSVPCRRAGPRDLALFAAPDRWPRWPFLPLVRQLLSQEEPEQGILYDARGHANLYGHASTVFLTNVFFIPASQAEFLALPRHVYDTFDELADAGWVVD